MREMLELTLKTSEPLNKGGFVSASVNKEVEEACDYFKYLLNVSA